MSTFMKMSDTIFAVASGAGKSAIAIFRVSGPQSMNILKCLCMRERWAPRQAIYCPIYSSLGDLIDKGIVLFFDRPRSFTGEDMIEFQITGGAGIKSTLVRSLLTFPETRVAEPGEFARRAFKNGKIDLVQVEGLAAIVEAETQAEVRHSALMAHGKLSYECERARVELLHAASLIEGFLDFSDVEDPFSESIATVFKHLRVAQGILQGLTEKSHVAERLRSGFTVAIVGKPNAGKSTLINDILCRDAVLVSEIPGTTRDYLEFFIELEGLPIVLVDTAGFREASDPIEKMGIEKSKDRVRSVDLIIWLDECWHENVGFLPGEIPIIKVISKGDLAAVRAAENGVMTISARTGEGVADLVRHILAKAKSFFENSAEPGLGSERQVRIVGEALRCLERALAGEGIAEELLAEDIRAALVSVGRITGRVDVEDVLDEVFARLCVGK
jgi:tRNA modification GTPase